MDNLELISKIKDLEQRLKDAQEIINAYHAGMEAQKKEIARLNDKVNEALGCFGYDER